MLNRLFSESVKKLDVPSSELKKHVDLPNVKSAIYTHEPPKYTTTKKEFVAQHGLNPDQLAKINISRHMAPQKWTNKKLQTKLNLPKNVIEKIAPHPRNYLIQRKLAIANKTQKPSVSDTAETKINRLVSWWANEFSKLPEKKKQRREYVKTKNRLIEEIDFEMIVSSEKRDEDRDKIAEAKRIKKRVALSQNKK